MTPDLSRAIYLANAAMHGAAVANAQLVASITALTAPARLYCNQPSMCPNALPIAVSGIAGGPALSPEAVTGWIAQQPPGMPWVMDLEPPAEVPGYGPGTHGATVVQQCAAAVAQIKAARPKQQFAGIFDFPNYGWYLGNGSAPQVMQWGIDQTLNVAPAYAGADWTTIWGYWLSKDDPCEKVLSAGMLSYGQAVRFGKRVLCFLFDNFTDGSGPLSIQQFATLAIAFSALPGVDLCLWNPAPAAAQTPGVGWINNFVQPGGWLKF